MKKTIWHKTQSGDEQNFTKQNVEVGWKEIQAQRCNILGELQRIYISWAGVREVTSKVEREAIQRIL
jgi:hypothetical protein